MEATRAMIHDQDLPKFLWGEVANTTCMFKIGVLIKA